MKIKNNMVITETFEFSQLKPGDVYMTENPPMYILATDEELVVDLETGIAYRADDFTEQEEFVLVNATLEILYDSSTNP